MYNKNNNSITLKLGNLAEKFREATQIVSRSGLTVAMDQVMEIMIISELSRLDPNDIAKRFKRAMIKALSKVSDEIDEDIEDDEDTFDDLEPFSNKAEKRRVASRKITCE